MRNLPFPLFLAITFLVTFGAYAQRDNESIMHAKSSLRASRNCDKALRSLDKVSGDGKKTADYLLCMGQVEDCKSNTEQAIYYYKKYLEAQPANDSVKKRVAELSDQKTDEDQTTTRAKTKRPGYLGFKHRKKSKGYLSISDNFSLVGASYDVPLGGANAPYKSGVSLYYSHDYPIIDNHLILGYSLNFTDLFAPNKAWFGRVFGVPDSEVSGVGNGYSVNIMFIPRAVILNRHKLALTVGPEMGFAFFYTPQIPGTPGGGTSFNDGDDLCLNYGLRSDLFLGAGLVLSVEYATSAIKSVSAEYNTSISQSTPVNRDMLRIGITYRFQTGWWNGWGL